MAVSASFRAFVAEQLDGPKRATFRPMFGGVGIYWDGAFFALIDDDCLYFKVDDATRPRFRALGSAAFDPFKNGKTMEGYYQVPADILEDRDALAQWRESAVGVARAGKVKVPGAATGPKPTVKRRRLDPKR
ncbi:MAG: TfoX/Sxy family protein [Gemmatimonadetes bacterium]|nr:TfoX/Sxy family protein [Gemmatimonadota bacterium]